MRLVVGMLDFAGLSAMFFATRASWAIVPAIITAAGNLEYLTQPGKAVGFAVFTNEAVFHFVAFAKKMAVNSTGRRNTCLKSIGWRSESHGLSWALIQA